MNVKPGDLPTTEDLAAYLKIPNSTLDKLVREGNIPPRRSACTGASGKRPSNTGLRKCEQVTPIQEKIDNGRTARR